MQMKTNRLKKKIIIQKYTENLFTFH